MKPTPAAVTAYLKIALVGILTSGSSGYESVALELDMHGNVIKSSKRGVDVLVSDAIPSSATSNRKIAYEKKDAVERFLKSLGLSYEQAKDVIETIGLEPEPPVMEMDI